MKRSTLITSAVVVTILIIAGMAGYLVWHARQNSLQHRMAVAPKGFSTVIGIKETIDKGLNKPLSVTVDEDGRIYVVDSVNNRIARFNPQGNFDKIIGTAGSKPGQLRYPVAIVTFGDNLYVADLYNFRVQIIKFPGLIFNRQGKFLSSLPLPQDRHKAGAIKPLALAVDANGDLYVADGNKQRIVVFGPTGKFLRQFGRAGTKPGQFSFINGLAVDDQSKKLYVADSNNGRVQILSWEGKPLGEINGTNFTTTMFYPRGIALDQRRKILYVSDTLGSIVYAYNLNNRKAKTIGQKGDGVGEYQFPGGLALDGAGNLYVADRQNNRVVVYSHNWR